MPLDPLSSKKLKRRLPYGFRKRVLDRLSPIGEERHGPQISMVLNGHRDDPAVLKALVWVAEEHEATLMKQRLMARGKVRLTRKHLLATT